MSRIHMIHGDPESAMGSTFNGIAYFQRLVLSFGISMDEANATLRWVGAAGRDDLPDRIDGTPAREAFLIGMLAASVRLGEMTWPTTRGEYKTRKGQQKARGAKGKKADARRAEIAEAVEAKLRRRGRRKAPSTTSIYADVAEAFGVSVPTVRRACGK